MRDILFRGKRIDNGEWVYGWYCKCPNGRWPLVDCIKNNSYEVDPETVGQYTGLKDCKGQKIFEGDIFEFDDEAWSSCYTSCGMEYDSCEVKNHGVIGYNEDCGCFDFIQYQFHENSVEADLHENHALEFADFVQELEVIGNIYDNPELLEVKQSDD